jgi:site-specific recombinase XerD
MKYVVCDQVVLSKAPEGPLAAYIGSFAKFVSAQGYALSTIRRQVRLCAGFSRWLERKRVESRSIRTEHVEKYLRYRARQVQIGLGDVTALRYFIEFLRGERVVPAEKVTAPQLTPVEHCTQAYAQYLRETCALSEATILNYVPFIRNFLNDHFGDEPVTLSRLCAHDVVRFVQRQAPRLHRKRAKLMTSALRSFFRYARYRGDLALDLAAAVPVVANWSMPSIPRAISAEQVHRLLASIDQHTAIGRRDYAILLLLARLGLRASEVAFLELDDIHWNTGTLNVRSKSGRLNEFPLSQEVGKAIAAYLQDGRPPSTSRRVFLRAKAPNRGFLGASGVGSIVRRSLKRAGIKAPTYGAHQFRHGLATEMLRQGASLGEIGDVLGHRHPQTTKIYTKVDLVALRTLALPWPGDVQ